MATQMKDGQFRAMLYKIAANVTANEILLAHLWVLTVQKLGLTEEERLAFRADIQGSLRQWDVPGDTEEFAEQMAAEVQQAALGTLKIIDALRARKIAKH